jgi:hypothetical protein
MKTSSMPAAFAALISIASFSAVGGAHAAECNVKNTSAVFGVSMTGWFDVSSGRACTYGYSSGGAMKSAKVTQQAQHGSVRLINNSSFEYRSKTGYTGTDAFVIEAVGRDLHGTGTSVLTYNINVR